MLLTMSSNTLTQHKVIWFIVNIKILINETLIYKVQQNPQSTLVPRIVLQGFITESSLQQTV